MNYMANSSPSSSETDVGVNERKRYKLLFEPGYKPSHVSRQTRRIWELKREKFKMKSKLPIPAAACPQVNTSSVTSDSSPESGDQSDQIHIALHASTTSEAEIELVNEAENTLMSTDSAQFDENVPHYDEPNRGEQEHIEEQNNSEYSDIDDIQSESSDFDEDDEDDDVPVGNQKIDFFNKTMFPESKLKVNDVIAMITALSLDLKLSDEGKLKLGKFTKILAGEKFDNLSLSKYMMDKCFSSQDEYVTYHFYCNTCTQSELYSVGANEKDRNKNIICPNCNSRSKINAQSSNYFLSIDLKYQIEQLLSDPVMIDDILNNVESRDPDSDYIADVNAGSIHKKILNDFAANSTDESEIICTVNMNTDGAPLTRSGKRGFWPVQIILNDLSPKLRFRNVLLSGLLLTESEPKSDLLNLYLSEVYCKQINLLYTEGIEITYKDRDIVFKFCTHACPVDSVCRPIIQNRVQFNGYSGCSWGYQLGEYVPSVRGIRYPVNQRCNERTDISHQNDVENVEVTGKISNGVRGDSVMSTLRPSFDMVWSLCYEYLHGLCLGPVLGIVNEWKNGDSCFKLSKQQMDFIEKRFLRITPTQEIHRLPRSGIIKGTARPKASELKSWLLYYSLPCLKNVLHEDALQHFSLLVKSSFTALKPAQTAEELNECDEDLLSFEVDYEMYYGKEKMTFNNHTLRHVVSSIRKTGSLCYNSAFPFESNICTLKAYVNGPKGMDRQIARKHLQYILLKTGNIGKIASSERAIIFCSTLFNRKRYSKSFRHGEDIVYCGKSELRDIVGLGKCLVYKRCIYKHTLYQTENYAQLKRSNNSMIQLSSGAYAKIVLIIDYQTKPYIQVRLFNMFPEDPFPGVRHIRKIASECANKIIIPISDIKCKVLLVNARNARYLCKMPNDFEVQ